MPQDPKFFTTKSGSKLATFSLATTEYKKDLVNQEVIKETQWHKVVVLSNKCLAVVENMIRKGSKVFVIGKVQYQKYPTASGEFRYSTEITLKDYTSTLIVLESHRNHEQASSSSSFEESLDDKKDNDFDYVTEDSSEDEDDNF